MTGAQLVPVQLPEACIADHLTSEDTIHSCWQNIKTSRYLLSMVTNPKAQPCPTNTCRESLHHYIANYTFLVRYGDIMAEPSAFSLKYVF